MQHKFALKSHTFPRSTDVMSGVKNDDKSEKQQQLGEKAGINAIRGFSFLLSSQAIDKFSRKLEIYLS